MSHVRVEIDSDRIATLWLDAPGKRVNTLSRQMWADLAGAIDRVEREKVVGVIITSAKPHSFCVGADLFEIRDMNDEAFDQYIRTGQEILNRIEKLPVAVIAAINGDCLGGGFELSLACTERLVVPGDAKLGLPEVNLGLIPGWGGTVRLSKVTPFVAISLISNGSLMSPNEARGYMIVDEPVSVKKLLSTAKEMAPALMPIATSAASFSPYVRYYLESNLAVHNSTSILPVQKKLIEVILEGVKHGAQAGFDAERKAIVKLRRTPECQEAMQRFFDRKKPS